VSQIKQFKAELLRFKEKFRLHGPGSVGTDLDKGFTISKIIILAKS